MHVCWPIRSLAYMFPDPRGFPPPTIAVVDTNVWINFKTEVREGSVAFPRQVVREMLGQRHPDAPGACIAGEVRRLVRYSQPSEEALPQVLAVASQLVEPDSSPDQEVADPDVAAMALQIVRECPESRVVVVTNDVVDRLPNKIALRTACRRLGIDTCQLPALLECCVTPATALFPIGSTRTRTVLLADGEVPAVVALLVRGGRSCEQRMYRRRDLAGGA